MLGFFCLAGFFFFLQLELGEVCGCPYCLWEFISHFHTPEKYEFSILFFWNKILLCQRYTLQYWSQIFQTSCAHTMDSPLWNMQTWKMPLGQCMLQAIPELLSHSPPGLPRGQCETNREGSPRQLNGWRCWLGECRDTKRWEHMS